MSNIKMINGIFLSFLLGGAIGGAIALLYAPQKGKNLRKDIRKKTKGFIKEGKKITHDSWNDAKEKAENIIESANDALTSNYDKIVRKTEQLKHVLNKNWFYSTAKENNRFEKKYIESLPKTMKNRDKAERWDSSFRCNGMHRWMMGKQG